MKRKKQGDGKLEENGKFSNRSLAEMIVGSLYYAKPRIVSDEEYERAIEIVEEELTVAQAEPHHSPSMRPERAKSKSRRDVMRIAQGKRSAALGCGPKVISSFFPSGWARLWRAQPEGKKLGGVGFYPGRRPPPSL